MQQRESYLANFLLDVTLSYLIERNR